MLQELIDNEQDVTINLINGTTRLGVIIAYDEEHKLLKIRNQHQDETIIALSAIVTIFPKQ